MQPSRLINTLQSAQNEKPHSPTPPQVGTWEWDFASGAVTWSHGLYRLLGLEPGAVPASYDLFIGKVHPEDRLAAEAAGRASMTEGGAIDHDFRIVTCDGAVRWMTSKGEVFNDSTGKPSWAAGALFDITDIREAQLELAAREERYRALATANAIGDWRATAAGDVLEAGFWMDFTGQAGCECQGEGWLDAVHPDDRESISALWHEAIGLGCGVEFIYRARHYSGAYRWVLTKAVPLRNPDGSVREWIGSDEDIHARRAAEESLRINENRLRLALETARTITWEHNFATGFITRSENALEVLGFGSGAVEEFFSFIHPADSIRVREALCRTEQTGERYDVEYRVTDPSGRTRWMRARGDLLRTAHDRGDRMIGITFDVSAEKQANLHQRRIEEELNELTARLHTLGSVAGGLVWTTSANGKVTDVPGWREFTGQSLQEIQGWGWLNAIHPADRERTRDMMQRLMDRRLCETVEYRVRSLTGEYHWFRSRGAPVVRSDGSVSGWVGICKRLRTSKVSADSAGAQVLGVLAGDEPQLISGAQVRAARAIVNWSVRDLAEASGVSGSTIRRIEEDAGLSETRDLRKLETIRKTLERAGVEFVPAVGAKGGVRPA